MKNVITFLKNETVYFLAVVLGITLIIPSLDNCMTVKAEYYLSALSLANIERNISYVVQFIPHYIPLLIIQIYFGISIYKNFCVASIYVFSRQNHRVKWAIIELFKLFIKIISFVFVYIFSALITVSLFPSVLLDAHTFKHTIIMTIILSLYSFEMIIFINLLAFYFESGVAFAIVQILNMISISVYFLSEDLHIEDSFIINYNVFYRLMVKPDLDCFELLISIGFFLIPSFILVLLIIGAVTKTEFTKYIYEGDN